MRAGNGQACQFMALASDNVCLDQNGNVVEEGLDTGSNAAPEDGGEGCDDHQAGGWPKAAYMALPSALNRCSRAGSI